MTDTIDTGTYYVNAPCPRCGVIEEILVAVRSKLTIPQDEIGKLGVAVKGKARDHDCKQARRSSTLVTVRLPEDES